MAFNARQNLMIRSSLLIAQKLGPWDKGIGGDGAHYMSPAQNGFRSAGMVCHNCAFWNAAAQSCAVVAGKVEPEGLCKLWVIDEARLGVSSAPLNSGRPRTLEAVK